MNIPYGVLLVYNTVSPMNRAQYLHTSAKKAPKVVHLPERLWANAQTHKRGKLGAHTKNAKD